MQKKAIIITWEKFQDHEVIYPYYALKEHGFEVVLCGGPNLVESMVFSECILHVIC